LHRPYDARMDIAELRPVAAALLLPPAGPLLLALAGALLGLRHRRAGAALLLSALALLWLLACQAVAMALAGWLLPPVAPVSPALLAAARPQALVVLGGGLLPQAPEYGQPQPTAPTLARLRYGAHLARATGLPLAFAGGIGWAATGLATEPEGDMARRVLAEWGLQARWIDSRSRDTRENAQLLRPQLERDGVKRIVLVTSASHMARAQLEFRRAGFEVLPAPTGLLLPHERPLLAWLPSAYGLAASREVLREWLGLQVAASRGDGPD